MIFQRFYVFSQASKSPLMRVYDEIWGVVECLEELATYFLTESPGVE